MTHTSVNHLPGGCVGPHGRGHLIGCLAAVAGNLLDRGLHKIAVAADTGDLPVLAAQEGDRGVGLYHGAAFDSAHRQGLGRKTDVVAAVGLDREPHLIKLRLVELHVNNDASDPGEPARVHLDQNGGFLARRQVGLQRPSGGAAARNAHVGDLHGRIRLVDDAEGVRECGTAGHGPEVTRGFVKERFRPGGGGGSAGKGKGQHCCEAVPKHDDLYPAAKGLPGSAEIPLHAAILLCLHAGRRQTREGTNPMHPRTRSVKPLQAVPQTA